MLYFEEKDAEPQAKSYEAKNKNKSTSDKWIDSIIQNTVPRVLEMYSTRDLAVARKEVNP